MSCLIRSLEILGAPQHILAAFDLLQFETPSADRLKFLNHLQRKAFLQWSDERQLTLMLPAISQSPLPGWLREQAMERTARYEARFVRLKRELFEIAEAFNKAGLEFVMLKGLSHTPAFMPAAQLRAQGDIDLWLVGPSVYRAQHVLRRLGYVPQLASKSRHLAPMTRPSNWRWRGDLFDPEMPVSVELHYELWDEHAEFIAIPGLEQFWNRKEVRDFDGHKIHVLCEADLLGFASLHLLLHLLHGDLPLQRAWEIGRFLNDGVSDDAFWSTWHASHCTLLRRLETVVFYVASRWFGCRVARELRTDAEMLPAAVQRWLEQYSLAPVKREWAPNKAEIWLHLALIDKRRDKARVLFRRLFPTSIPNAVDGTDGRTLAVANLLNRSWLRLLVTRFTRHAATFLPTLFEGLRWSWLRKVRGPYRRHKARCADADPRGNPPCSVPSVECVELRDVSRRRSNAHCIPE